MYTVKLICPYCIKETGAVVTCIDSYSPAEERSVAGKTLKYVHFHCLCKCPDCKNPILVTAETTLDGYENIRKSIEEFQFSPSLTFIKVLKYYPEPPKPYTHESLPDEVKTLYADLQRILWEGKSPSIVVSGCRSVLEASLNALQAKGNSIKEKIDYLYETHAITKVLADWAHHIRIEGNFAIHEIKTTPEEAQEIVEFTKIFLIYTFELPYRIALLSKK